MASMVSLPPLPVRALRRISVAALLLASAPCLAQQAPLPNNNAPPTWTSATEALSRPEAAFPRGSGSINDTIMNWRRLNDGSMADFTSIASFLVANPGWPNEDKLRKNAEAAIALDSYAPVQTLAYFKKFPPLTAGGHLRQAMALNASGLKAEAMAAARLAWTSGSLNEFEESRALSLFPGAFTTADHDARMDRLLWEGATRAAARQLAWVSPARQPVFAARLAMRTKAVDTYFKAQEAERLSPDVTRRDAGYITDKATWLRGTGQSFPARALLATRRDLAAPPADAEEWYETLLTNARAAANDGNQQTAYDIARQLDDGFAPGTEIKMQPIGVRDDYTSLAWLAGTTAMKKLGRPGEAVGLFRRYAEAARSPQTQSKGMYWAGRAALAAGDQAGAMGYFEQAAKHYDQFYGQLSLERLGRPQPKPVAPATVAFSQVERDNFVNNSLVRAVRTLGEQGQWRDQTLFLRAISMNARSNADHYFAGRLSQEIGRPDLGVMIGRSARINGIDDYEPAGFPTVRVPDGHQSNWTFIHAITRQESQFDKAAMSHAGARGLMQLMPGTARETAGKIGLSYDLGALTTDTNYNVMLGSTYFQSMLRYFGGSYPLAVAAYNAGPGNVNKWLAANGDPRGGALDIIDWIEAIPIFETRNYVQRVLENAVVYDTINPASGRTMPAAPLSFYLGKRTPG